MKAEGTEETARGGNAADCRVGPLAKETSAFRRAPRESYWSRRSPFRRSSFRRSVLRSSRRRSSPKRRSFSRRSVSERRSAARSLFSVAISLSPCSAPSWASAAPMNDPPASLPSTHRICAGNSSRCSTRSVISSPIRGHSETSSLNPPLETSRMITPHSTPSELTMTAGRRRSILGARLLTMDHGPLLADPPS